jgi:hypothetical protein
LHTTSQRVQRAPNRATGTAVLTLLFCSAFQFFHSIGDAFETHPLAPFLLLELTLALLIAIAVFSMARRIIAGRLRPLDLFFFLFPFFWLLLSSVFAWLTFDQPLIYGLSEERRILTFLYWFVFDPVHRRFALKVGDILTALILCACVYLITAVGLQILVPDQLSGRALPDLDTRRLRMSAAGECFAITFIVGVVGCLVTKRYNLNLLATVVGFVGLVQVAQARQLTLAAAATLAVLMLRLRPTWTIVTGAVVVIAFLVTTSVRGPVVITQLSEAVLPNLSEFFGANLLENTRINTLGIVTDLLTENYFFGLGAVSLLYDGGLARLYGRNFFINDVGVLGEVFRVGFFYAAFFCAYAITALRLWQRVDRPQHRHLIFGIYFFYLMLAPTNGIFYRLGFVHAFLFLLLSAAATRVAASSSAAYLAPQPAASVRGP